MIISNGFCHNRLPNEQEMTAYGYLKTIDEAHSNFCSTHIDIMPIGEMRWIDLTEVKTLIHVFSEKTT